MWPRKIKSFLAFRQINSTEPYRWGTGIVKEQAMGPVHILILVLMGLTLLVGILAIWTLGIRHKHNSTDNLRITPIIVSIIAVLVLTGSILAFAASFHPPNDLWEAFVAFGSAMALLVSATFWLLILNAFFARRRAQTFLFDLGPSPDLPPVFTGIMGIFAVIVSVVTFLFHLFEPSGDGQRYEPLVRILTGVSIGLYLSLVALSRRAIYETGIWVFPGFLTWQQIISYRWEGNSLVLAYRWRSRVRWWNIPLTRNEALGALLVQHLPPGPSSQSG